MEQLKQDQTDHGVHTLNLLVGSLGVRVRLFRKDGLAPVGAYRGLKPNLNLTYPYRTL